MNSHGLIALAEGVVLALAIVGAVLLVSRRPCLRELRSHPRLGLAAAAVATLALLTLSWLIVWYEPVRHVAAGAVALGLLALFLRSRPNHGRRRGLPPGSLGLLASLDAIDDRDFYARSAKRWGPIFKMSQFHRPVVCVADLQTWLEFDAMNADALVQSDWSFNRLVPGGYLEYMNGEQHTRYRELLAPAFTQSIVDAAAPTMALAAREQLAAMHRAAHPNGIHPEPFLLPVAQISLLRCILGVGSEHPQYPQLREYFTDLNRPMELFLPAPRSSQETFRWLATAVGELAANGVSHPSVLGTLRQSHPNLSEDETAIGNLVLMVKEGGIMVRGMLRWIIKMLADHPETVASIRAARDEHDLNVLTTAFVQETIRLHESPYLYRSVVRDTELGPYRIPRGWLVRLCLAEAHSDESTFTRPQEFDPSRFVQRASPNPPAGRTPGGFCPFGHGTHACLGGDMAIAIAKAVVRECALGYDIRPVHDGAAWRINRHWGLWRPSKRFQVVMKPLAPGPPS